MGTTKHIVDNSPNQTINGDISITGTFSTTGFKMTSGATSGYVLTSDSDGNATWVIHRFPICNIENIQHTGTSSETIKYTLKVPANYYKIGDDIPPYCFRVIGAYASDDNTDTINPSPILTPASYDRLRGEQYSNVIYLSQNGNGYTSSTVTFSQATTTGNGSGAVFEVKFDANGNWYAWDIIDGGNGYVQYDEITTEDKGSGSLLVTVQNTVTSSDPIAIIRSYWSYNEESPLANIFEQRTLTTFESEFNTNFNVTNLNNESGWESIFSQITSDTNFRSLGEPVYENGKIAGYQISNTTIPNINQDVWITFTVELQDQNSSLYLSLIKLVNNLGDIATNFS
jgi:hypothetical protein